MQTEASKLTDRHQKLTHSEMMKVSSHVQRNDGEWIINTLTIEGHDVPFKFRRKTAYKDIRGQRVNLTYYPVIEKVAGMDFEVMKVVRIKVS